MARIAMAIAKLAHPRSGAAEMHACMIEAVGEDKGLGAEHGAVEQGLQDSGIGLKARSEDQARLLAFERGEF